MPHSPAAVSLAVAAPSPSAIASPVPATPAAPPATAAARLATAFAAAVADEAAGRTSSSYLALASLQEALLAFLDAYDPTAAMANTEVRGARPHPQR